MLVAMNDIHPLAITMVLTFVAAIATLVVGIAGMGRAAADSASAKRANQLMMLRVGLCVLLLIQIIFYVIYIKN